MTLTQHLVLEDIKPSIGTVGDAYDKALMECVIGLYKTECIRTTIFVCAMFQFSDPDGIELEFLFFDAG